MRRNNRLMIRFCLLAVAMIYLALFIGCRQETGGQIVHAETGDEPGENHLELSEQNIRMIGLKTDQVRMVEISRMIELPGEVGFDEDRFCRVIPRFPGIVKRVNKKLGDPVKSGDILAVIESNESLSSYSSESMISGIVVGKNITPGEFVSDESAVYEVADLTRVWVNLMVYAKDYGDIRIGQTVSIQSVGTENRCEGLISYIDSFLNRESRNLMARVVVDNSGGLWLPGTFVRGSIRLKANGKVPAIVVDTVQFIGEQSMVFVPSGENEFTPVPVILGESDGQHVRVVKGLEPGDRYVSRGAFELKAELITRSLGGHAGHGH